MKVSQLTLVSASLIIFSFLPPHAAQAALTDGLVGHWTLDGKDVSWATGTVTDRSGQGNSGKVVSMSTTTATVAGKISQGLSFNGSTNYITVPDNDTFTITGARTFSLWMKTASTTGFRAINKSTGPILNTSEWALGTSGGGLYYAIFYDSGATANNCSVGSTVSASTDVNIWTHLIVTYSGSGGCSGIKLYRNAVDVTGSISNAGTGFSSFSNTSAPVTLGVLHKGDPVYEAWAKGTMDDVRIYNRALSAQEIQQLYAQGAAKMGVSPSPSSGQQGLGAGLVGHWTLDGKDVSWATGTVTDKSGQGNSGKVVSMSTTTSPVAGKVGQGLKFDGSDDYVLIPNNSVLDVTSAYTVSMWVNLATTTQYYNFITRGGASDADDLEIYGAPGAQGFTIAHNRGNGGTFAYCANANGTTDTDGAGWGGFPVKKWTHLTATYDGTNWRVYFNGAQQGSACPSGGVHPSDTNKAWTIGTAEHSGFDLLGYDNINATIDDVRIYNRALSAQEVRQLYAQGATKMGVSPSSSSGQQGLGAGLVGHWTLDGKDVSWATGTVTDKSGQGNSGKVVSMSTTTSPVAGRVGQGLKFDGSNDYVNAGNTSALQITGAVTVSAWVKATTTATNGGIAGKYDSTSSQRGYLLAQENVGGSKKITWYYQNLAGTFDSGDSVTTLSDVLDNKWHHVVGVYSPSSYGRIYVDGILNNEDTTSIDSSIADNTASFLIGAFNSGVQPINSSIDDVRVYNRALSATEIKQLYSVGKATNR